MLVLQKALAFAHEPFFSILIKAIIPHLEKLKQHFPFGNKLYLKLVNSYNEFQNCQTVEPTSNENSNSFLINQNNSSYINNKRTNKRSYKNADSQKTKSNKFSSNFYN